LLFIKSLWCARVPTEQIRFCPSSKALILIFSPEAEKCQQKLFSFLAKHNLREFTVPNRREVKEKMRDRERQT
jgi:hypothetical protein